MAIPLDLQRIARALGGEVRNGQILAPGPNHSRVDRSMSVRLDSAAPDGFVVNSFAGDAPLKCKDYVRQKCGLPAFGTHEEPLMAASSVAATGQPISDDMIAAALATVKTTPATPAKPLGVHTKTYDYSDADGTLLYQVLRYDYPKSFRQQRPNGDGGWIWKLGEKRVLYRLRELLKYAAGTVFICEGEKDADGLSRQWIFAQPPSHPGNGRRTASSRLRGETF